MRRLLIAYGAALTAAVLVAVLVPFGLLADALAQDRAVAAGRQEAQGLSLIVTTTGTQDLKDAVSVVNTGPRQTTVFMPDGRVVGHRASRTASVDLAAQGRAFTAQTPGGVEILVPVGGSSGVVVIRTFVSDEVLHAGVHTAWAILAATGLVLLVLAVVIGGRLASRLSRSLRDLADVAGRMGKGDLTARVQDQGPPEVASVGRVLNGLGGRITEMLTDERELGADLSHRLRTPVTALSLAVESLADDEERTRMTSHVDQLVAAIDAAVLASRHPAHLQEEQHCDAAAVVAERARFWGVLADETQRRLVLDVVAEAAPVPVSAADLGAALDALIDNVFGHTPTGTSFRLAVERAGDDSVAVIVEDEGSGLAESELAHRGRSGSGSTGIGLDVARRTTRQVDGTVAIGTSPAGGARIVMAFPARSLSES